MGDMISSLLFQPPPPTRLKESKVIWLTNSYGKRIPAFFIECPKEERTGEGIRAPLPGEQQQSFSKGGKFGVGMNSSAAGGSSRVSNSAAGNNNASSGPMSFSASGEEGISHHNQVPSTPQIRTSKELELSFLNGGRMGGGGGGSSSISPCAPTILYSHANAEDLGNIYPWCKFLSKMLGVNIFAYDYTGYGLATDQGEF